MVVLSGADLVLPNHLLSPGSLLIDGGRIMEVRPGRVPRTPGHEHFDLHDHYVVPGFVDVHVHGVLGHDVLDGPEALLRVAQALPSFGVTAFCPTSVACPPQVLRRFLRAVAAARSTPAPRAARVLPAHLESNFLNPEYRGAQPADCLRLPPTASAAAVEAEAPYSAHDLMAEITGRPSDVGIVTMAPEMTGGFEFIRMLRARGHLVSLGHSGATYEEAREAIAAGASQATHLFNRMPKLDHRRPGLAGAVLEAEELAAELVCDGFHVHPAMMRAAIAAKTPARMMAITDATAGAGMPVGTRVALGGQPIDVGKDAAFLGDGTLAGSVLTMDGAFRVLIGKVGLAPTDAAMLCAATPARELRLDGHGVIAPGAVADLAVLDRRFEVRHTWIGGALAYSREAQSRTSPVSEPY